VFVCASPRLPCVFHYVSRPHDGRGARVNRAWSSVRRAAQRCPSANGPLVIFSIFFFEHLFHRLFTSQFAAAVMGDKSLQNLNDSETTEMYFWTASSCCRGSLRLAVAQSTFCTFGDGRAVVFRPSRINRLVPHHDMSSDPLRVTAKSKPSDLVDDAPYSNGPHSKRRMSWLPRGSSGEKVMGMEDGQSTRPHQGDRHIMTRRMWILRQEVV